MLTGQVGRPHGRLSQDPVDRAVDRRAQTCARLLAQWVGRPVGRPDQRALLSVSGRSTGRPSGTESFTLYFWAVDRAVDRATPTVGNLTVGGRPAGRPPACQADRFSLTASFCWSLYIPHFLGVFTKIFRAKFSPFSGFKNKFSKVFKEQKGFILFVLGFWKNQRK